MLDQEFIMLIMNCKKYQKKAIYQKRTWLKTIPPYLKYYHVIGDETLDSEYKFDDENKILWIKVPDDYNSLPKKVISAYEAIYNTFNFKYLFKTDDDQILVKPQFFTTIQNLLTNNNINSHYGGHIVNINNHNSIYHNIHPELPPNLPLYKTQYSSGRFYFLSKDAITHLISKKQFIMKEYFEDYAIGFHLDKKFKINMIPITTDKIFIDIEKFNYIEELELNKI